MEKLYRKKENGRYEPIGYCAGQTLEDGIWLVQSEPGITSMTSLLWKVGEVKRPVDVVSFAAITAMADKIGRYLSNLREKDSEEYKEAENLLGGYLTGEIRYYGISPYDLASLVLRKIAFLVEESNELVQDDKNQ